MTTQSPEERTLLGRIAAAGRWSKDDDPEAAKTLAEARAELATIQIEKYVRRTLDAAPSLNTSQRDRLRALLAADEAAAG